ncbi:hypothetical protein C8Q76DRAFT_483735 [Earliella scabrosa]|nr:hypothetical protein C8Q76DRAFT_483735 [Earliella scabrosa]
MPIAHRPFAFAFVRSPACIPEIARAPSIPPPTQRTLATATQRRSGPDARDLNIESPWSVAGRRRAKRTSGVNCPSANPATRPSTKSPSTTAGWKGAYPRLSRSQGYPAPVQNLSRRGKSARGFASVRRQVGACTSARGAASDSCLCLQPEGHVLDPGRPGRPRLTCNFPSFAPAFVRAGAPRIEGRSSSDLQSPRHQPSASRHADLSPSGQGALIGEKDRYTASITGYRSIENVSENLPITSWDKGPFVSQTFHKHFMPCSKHVKGLDIWGCTPCHRFLMIPSRFAGHNP